MRRLSAFGRLQRKVYAMRVNIHSDPAAMRAYILRYRDGEFRLRLLRLCADRHVITWAEGGRALSCDPRTVRDHTFSLAGMGLLKQTYDAPTRSWAYRPTEFGLAVNGVSGVDGGTP